MAVLACLYRWLMFAAETKLDRRGRWRAAMLATLLHGVVIVALIRAFAPDLGESVVRPALQAFDVALAPVSPPTANTPKPAAKQAARNEGAAAPAGKKAVPRSIAAPRAAIVLSPVAAPPVVGTGSADTAGAAASGAGTGSGGSGHGLGAGASGAGTGGGGGGGSAKPVKIAGDIVSARDYPAKTRDLRLGSAVTIALTVTTDGRVGNCRIVRPSKDPEADRITCRLATERFRFRPARDASGRPVEAIYGWQQRWFAPAP